MAFLSFLLGIFTVSIYSILSVSIDRYVAICHPLFYHKSVGTKTTIISIITCWLLGIAGFLPLFGWQNRMNKDSCDQRQILDDNYIIFFSTFAAFFPTVILIGLYVSIYRKICGQVRLNSQKLSLLIFFLLFVNSRGCDHWWWRRILPIRSLKTRRKQQKRWRWLLELSCFVGFPLRSFPLLMPGIAIDLQIKRFCAFSSFCRTSIPRPILLFMCFGSRMCETF